MNVRNHHHILMLLSDLATSVIICIAGLALTDQLALNEKPNNHHVSTSAELLKLLKYI